MIFKLGKNAHEIMAPKLQKQQKFMIPERQKPLKNSNNQNPRKTEEKWARLAGQIANYSQLITICFILISTFISTPAKAQSNSPIVVEMFTSKYCPACPASDRNFNKLINENPNIIGLSCHVTYFNGRSRKDLLSKAFCDARQNVYRGLLRTGGIFTPMMVENGKSFTTGIKVKNIQDLKNKAQKHENQPVGIERNRQYLDISLPSMALNKDATVWLIEVEKSPKQSGYTHYRNNIKNIAKLLNWDGKKINMAFPIIAPSANIGYTILVHNAKGRIIAAGKTGF